MNDPSSEAAILRHLGGHPKATRAYACSSAVDGSDRRQFYGVPHLGPIQSARDTVKAAIAAEHRVR